jgi:hypothetical protein
MLANKLVSKRSIESIAVLPFAVVGVDGICMASGIFEEVHGFGSRTKRGRFQHESPLEQFLSQLHSIGDEAGNQLYFSVVLELDSGVWVKASRPRTVVAGRMCKASIFGYWRCEPCGCGAAMC